MFDYSERNQKWRRLRASILRRDGYMDQVQKRYGKTIEARLVHHIFPADEYPEYAYEPWNLISISYATHKALHDGDELSELGVGLLRRTARKNGVGIPYRYSPPCSAKNTKNS